MTRSTPRPALAALLATAATLALAPRPAGAQTLTEALANAYANNPTLLAARAALRATDELVPQALAGWRPTVSVGGTYGASEGSARTRGNNTLPRTGPFNAQGQSFAVYSDTDRSPATANATLSQPLYRGGRTVAAVRQAENRVLAQRARLLAAEQEVLQATVAAYVAVIRDQETVRLNTNNEQVLARQLQATNERFRVGEITRTDVAQAESRLAGARATRSAAEGTLAISRGTFLRLVGQAPGRLTAPQPLSLPVRNAEEARRTAATNYPPVVAALFDEAAARDAVTVQNSALLPQLSLQGQSFRNDNSATQGTRFTGQAVTLNLTAPIYQGGAEYALVRQARQAAQQARGLVDEQRRTAVQLATQAWETLSSNRGQVESVRAQIRAAEIALDGVQREAIVGSRTTLEVLNAEQELLSARVSLINALANVVTASYALAVSTGRMTAQDLALPVPIYDMQAYYRAVRDRWVGLGDYSGAGQGDGR